MGVKEEMWQETEKNCVDLQGWELCVHTARRTQETRLGAERGRLQIDVELCQRKQVALSGRRPRSAYRQRMIWVDLGPGRWLGNVLEHEF